MADFSRFRVLGVPFNPIRREETIERCRELIAGDHFHLMVTLGTEMVMAAQTDTDFLEVIERADLVVPDGIGVVLATKLAGLRAPDRVTGVDLLKDLVQTATPDIGFFFYGTAPGIAQKAVDNLHDQFSDFNCVGVLDGFVKDQEEVLRTIEEARPKVLFVAMGFPRQEHFLYRNRERLERAGVRLGIGVGGSFDVYSGAVERAPTIVQKLYLEWLYRVLKQPSRWKRMMALPKFALRVLISPKSAVRVVE